jgi:pyruvate dehydrogenase E2 component (dihydrolipoamide acetyltransferase)
VGKISLFDSIIKGAIVPTEVIMPALGMSQETGRLVAWLKQAGESVNRGDILMEIETDKTTVEIEAAASGILSNVSAEAGDDVPVGSVIALILAEGEKAPAMPGKTATSQLEQLADTAVSPTPKSATPVAIRVAEAHGLDVSQIPSQGKRVTRADVEAYVDGIKPASNNGRILASPKARRLANEQGYDLSQIIGSGPDGAVLADDILNFAPLIAASVSQAVTQTSAQTGTMWRRMAERLTESWQTIPHFYLKREVDASAMMTWRKNILARSDVKVTFTDLLVKLVAVALREHPHANGQWNGQSVIFNEQVNVGLAVAVDEGLIVPVIHEADTLGIKAIAQRRKELVERAQNSRLQPNDLQGGTFTISNLGMFAIDEFSAIVNPPQAAILAVGSISERVVPVDGEAVIRPIITLSLSCDHRAVDGARGAQFLETLAKYIAEPLSIMD